MGKAQKAKVSRDVKVAQAAKARAAKAQKKRRKQRITGIKPDDDSFEETKEVALLLCEMGRMLHSDYLNAKEHTCKLTASCEISGLGGRWPERLKTLPIILTIH